jgi:hypothetical protein
MTRAISTSVNPLGLPSTCNWEYLTERVRRYNNEPSDDLLYRIGTHLDVLALEDQDLIEQQQGGYLNPQQRYRVLNWLTVQAEAGFVGLEIEGDLALLIFGRDQLTQWLEISRQAYPDFEFYLVFEFHPSRRTGWESGINCTMHWMPQPGAPEPDVECDFSWRLYWECGAMFWGDYPNNTTNSFDFSRFCYPNQQSFATPGSFCEEGDRYTTPSDEEADLMSVAQVLACPMLNARWS